MQLSQQPWEARLPRVVKPTRQSPIHNTVAGLSKLAAKADDRFIRKAITAVRPRSRALGFGALNWITRSVLGVAIVSEVVLLSVLAIMGSNVVKEKLELNKEGGAEKFFDRIFQSVATSDLIQAIQRRVKPLAIAVLNPHDRTMESVIARAMIPTSQFKKGPRETWVMDFYQTTPREALKLAPTLGFVPVPNSLIAVGNQGVETATILDHGTANAKLAQILKSAITSVHTTQAAASSTPQML